MDMSVNTDMSLQADMPAKPVGNGGGHGYKVVARDVDVFYGEKHAIKKVTVNIPDKAVMAFIGPSGCGKSTFLRSINRMNDTIPICRVTGKIEIEGQDIYADAPQAHSEATRLSSIAVGTSTAMPSVCTAASVSTVMVIDAPAMLMVAPSGIDTE